MSSSFSSSSPHTDSLTPPNPRPPNSRPPPPGPPCGSGLHFIIPIRADPVQDPQCWVTILQILLAKFKQKNCFEEKKKIIYLFLKLNLSCLSICLTMFILDKILMNGRNFEPTEHLVKQQQPVTGAFPLAPAPEKKSGNSCLLLTHLGRVGNHILCCHSEVQDFLSPRIDNSVEAVSAAVAWTIKLKHAICIFSFRQPLHKDHPCFFYQYED